MAEERIRVHKDDMSPETPPSVKGQQSCGHTWDIGSVCLKSSLLSLSPSSVDLNSNENKSHAGASFGTPAKCTSAAAASIDHLWIRNRTHCSDEATIVVFDIHVPPLGTFGRDVSDDDATRQQLRWRDRLFQEVEVELRPVFWANARDFGHVRLLAVNDSQLGEHLLAQQQQQQPMAHVKRDDTIKNEEGATSSSDATNKNKNADGNTSNNNGASEFDLNRASVTVGVRFAPPFVFGVDVGTGYGCVALQIAHDSNDADDYYSDHGADQTITIDAENRKHIRETGKSVVPIPLTRDSLCLPMHVTNDPNGTVTAFGLDAKMASVPKTTSFSVPLKAKIGSGDPFAARALAVLLAHMNHVSQDFLQQLQGSRRLRQSVDQSRFYSYPVREMLEQLYPSINASSASLLLLSSRPQQRKHQIQLLPCVLTVPAKFNHVQRREIVGIANMAGWDVLRLVNEPTAAAIAYYRPTAHAATNNNEASGNSNNNNAAHQDYGKDNKSLFGENKKEEKVSKGAADSNNDATVATAQRNTRKGDGSAYRILTFDYGAGTFDTALVDVDIAGVHRVMATDGDMHAGGVALDRRIYAHLAERLLRNHGVAIEGEEHLLLIDGIFNDAFHGCLRGKPSTTDDDDDANNGKNDNTDQYSDASKSKRLDSLRSAVSDDVDSTRCQLRYTNTALLLETERAKRALSTHTFYSFEIAVRGQLFQLEVTRRELEQWCHDLFRRAFSPFERVLRLAVDLQNKTNETSSSSRSSNEQPLAGAILVHEDEKTKKQEDEKPHVDNSPEEAAVSTMTNSHELEYVSTDDNNDAPFVVPASPTDEFTAVASACVESRPRDHDEEHGAAINDNNNNNNNANGNAFIANKGKSAEEAMATREPEKTAQKRRQPLLMVMLVGGGSAIPYVRQTLRDMVHYYAPHATVIDSAQTNYAPELSVASGAAIIGSELVSTLWNHNDVDSTDDDNSLDVLIENPYSFISIISTRVYDGTNQREDEHKASSPSPSLPLMRWQQPQRQQQKHQTNKKSIIFDVTAAAIGVKIYATQKTAPNFHTIVPRNTVYPTDSVWASDFVSAFDYQRRAAIDLYEGYSDYVENNVWIDRFYIQLPLLPQGQAALSLILQIDDSGCLVVSATSLIDGQTRRLEVYSTQNLTMHASGFSAAAIENEYRFAAASSPQSVAMNFSGLELESRIRGHSLSNNAAHESLSMILPLSKTLRSSSNGNHHRAAEGGKDDVMSFTSSSSSSSSVQTAAQSVFHKIGRHFANSYDRIRMEFVA